MHISTLADFATKPRGEETARDKTIALKRISGFTSRYIATIEDLRNVTLERVGKTPLNIKIDHTVDTIITGYEEGYFEKIRRIPQIETAVLNVTISDAADLLFKNYYLSTSNDCDLFSSVKVKKKLRYSGCNPDVESSFLTSHPLSEQTYALSLGLPANTSLSPWEPTSSVPLTYLHIIPNAFSLVQGVVLSNGVVLVPQRCAVHRVTESVREHIKNGRKRTLRQYKEMFAIGQYFARAYYHATIEQMTKLAPYMEFLKNNPQIRIQFGSKHHPFLPFFGFDSARFVSSDATAEILYVPAGNPCEHSPLFTTQLTSLLLQDNSTSHDTILLIKRSESRRWFDHHDAIYAMLQSLAEPRGIKVNVFADDPVPTAEETRRMFGSAFLIVAPHGAGLSNLILSKPGTMVLEAQCYRHGTVIHCYKSLALALGLRYYGLIFHKQCMDVTAEDIRKPVTQFLLWKDLERL